MDNIKCELGEVIKLLDNIIKELDPELEYQKRIKLVGINAEIKTLKKHWEEQKSLSELNEINKSMKRLKEIFP